MSHPTAAPNGSWASPISAADLVASTHPVDGAAFVGEEVWWCELRSAEGGRYSIRRRDASGRVVDVLPAPWNARTRVHEYGGGAWTVTAGRVLVFAEFGDQRLYALAEGEEPRPLTPAGHGFRFAELQVHGDDVLAVRESHGFRGGIGRDIVLVPLDGSAAGDAGSIRSLVSGSDFLAFPRISPGGSRLAWVAWNHPDMPWDSSVLRVRLLRPEGVRKAETVLGGAGESVLQPEWIDDSSLYAISDRSGWWNLYRIRAGAEAEPEAAPETVYQAEAEVGGPLWRLGSRWYLPLPDGRVAAVATLGGDTLCLIDPGSGRSEELLLPFTSIAVCDIRDERMLVLAGGEAVAGGLRMLDLTEGLPRVEDVRLDVDGLPDPGYLPRIEQAVFRGNGREVHALVCEPRNPEFTGMPGESAPFVAFVHGGPTAHVKPVLNLTRAYFTSRGIGVVDVNYGGSSGYGREYRERLRGQWGVVDVEDVETVVLGLVDAGRADPARLAIEGGSAGGWTVLAALTRGDVFAAGVSYYGVAELSEFVNETHDFESRYVDGLVGPLPEAAALYEERAPLSHVDRLRAPVLLLQGLADPIVPPAQAERFRDALVARGIPHAYVAYEGESHGFRRAETIIHARQSELSFYGQVFGFEADVPELELWHPPGRRATM